MFTSLLKSLSFTRREKDIEMIEKIFFANNTGIFLFILLQLTVYDLNHVLLC